MTHSQSVP